LNQMDKEISWITISGLNIKHIIHGIYNIETTNENFININIQALFYYVVVLE